MSERKTFADVQHYFIRRTALNVVGRFRGVVTPDDVHQQLYLWLLENKPKVERWLASDPQQTTRIWRSLHDAGRRYAEAEKSARAGYDVSDVFYYNDFIVDELLDTALNPDWTGEKPVNDNPGKSSKGRLSGGGNYLTMVMDVRRALKVLGNSTSTAAIVSFLNNTDGPMRGER